MKRKYGLEFSIYNIKNGTFIDNNNGPYGFQVKYASPEQARKAAAKLLQYEPGTAEYDERFLNSKVTILSIYCGEGDDFHYKRYENKAYIAACDAEYIEKIQPFLEDMEIITVPCPELVITPQSKAKDLTPRPTPRIYVGRWDLVEGGVPVVEEFTENEARAEMKREQKLTKDKRVDTYTLKELETELNNDLDEDEPFSLNYWIRIFEG